MVSPLETTKGLSAPLWTPAEWRETKTDWSFELGMARTEAFTKSGNYAVVFALAEDCIALLRQSF